MTINVRQIAELEWTNYVATARVAQVTPGLEVILRPDVILSSSQVFPTPDANHACLLRTAPESVDSLLAEIVDYFRSRDLPVAIFVSPACTPLDLADRLLAKGFVQQGNPEAWMVLEDLPHVELPPPSPQIVVRHIAPQEALTAAEIFMSAFGMPAEFAPAMAQLLEPSVGQPGIYHYLALVDDKPVGTCSLLCQSKFAILGSAGVIPDRRGGRAATNLTAQAIRDALAHGVQTLMLQTAAGTRLERLLRINGFKAAFTRTGYLLA